VLGPLRHVGALIEYLAARDVRRRSDHATVEQLAWPASRQLPSKLRLGWLGTAAYRFDYEGHTLLVDPYVTRLSFGQFIGRAHVPPDERALDRWFGDLSDNVTILIGHTHFDHALDTPSIARRTGAPVYGSRSLVQLMRISGLEHQAIEVEPYRTYERGPFAFRFVPSKHSKLALGLAVTMGGELTCDHLDQLAPREYRCGQVWGLHIDVAGTTFYHQGSADLVDDAIRADERGVDFFLCGISGRRFTDRYTARILRRLEPRVVVPGHYDNFFRPLDAPMDFSLNVNLTGFADEVRAVSRDFDLRTLAIDQPPPPNF
jgi:L-ascorbate metabolism protein UlaG (beta-lactamase superfamily)